MASLGSRHWERDGWEREQGKVGYGSYCYETMWLAGIKHSRYHGNESGGLDRPRSDPNVRLYPYSLYGCAGYSAILSLKGCTNDKIHHQNTNYE